MRSLKLLLDAAVLLNVALGFFLFLHHVTADLSNDFAQVATFYVKVLNNNIAH